MPELSHYQEFIERVEELGFLSLSTIVPGMPSLENETTRSAWFTGDPETDPWSWKDQSAKEKRLAYGCLLGGHKGFVAQRLYPLFYAACHPQQTMPERWAAGVVSYSKWQMWNLFEKHDRLDASQVRRLLGGTGKKGGSPVDLALKELQREFYITTAGNAQKISAAGEAYGWPSLVYCRVLTWLPEEWRAGAADWEPFEAREAILEQAGGMGEKIDLKRLRKKLGW